MKYGLLKHTRNDFNLGDYYIQYGVRQIYEEMGISSDDIIVIDQYSLTDYDGEYVVVPMAGFFDAFTIIRWLPLSPKIIPVFIGFHCVDEKSLRFFSENKRYEPIGCRDEETVIRLRRNGVQAYISGCTSLCIKKREKMASQTKVFVVEADEEVYKYFPADIKKDMVEIVHKRKDFQHMDPKEAEKVEMKIAEEVFVRYKNEARLVITSKMHCALPCIALGIPVIYVLPRYDCRWSGMDKFVHVYTREEYHKIDWNPQSIDIENVKDMIKTVAKRQISESVRKYSDICELSAFFENRERTVYFSGFQKSYLSDKQKIDFMQNKVPGANLLELIIGKRMSETNLIIWGAGDRGKWMCSRYKYELKKFKKCIFVDRCREKIGSRLYDYSIYGIDEINNYSMEETVIFVAANHYYEGAGYSIGCELIKQFGFTEGKEFFFLDVLDESGKLSISDFSTVQTWVDAL
ncbi:MAG: polysaccharide pyruvyl transferase family protein [Ruminococcus flavefaciens]|nr:polysaccharide pyruvyl transferase family protein [Ruminococcus flavefaciens]